MGSTRRLDRMGCRRPRLATSLAYRLGLNLADGVFQGQALAGDLGLRKGRIYAAKLRHQGRAGALIKCAPPLRGIVRKPLYGPGDEWMIVCHCSQFTLDSLKLHLMLRMGFA